MKNNHISLIQKQQQAILSSKINYLNKNNPERAPLEQFIHQVYKKYYAINLSSFYPHLISIKTTNNKLKAVAGIRNAATETLFSEYYLKQDLEITLKQCYGCNISRDSVVEVGNLAPASVGQMRWLITSITAFLHGAGFKYIVFTLAKGVYNAFKRMGLHLDVLADARRDCLPAKLQQEWNDSYYQASPKVLTGDIGYGFLEMQQNIRQANPQLLPLFEQAYQLGLNIKQANVSQVA